ncbi:hypothetical protein [Millisia brevis]|uniref:hypothetical protein n=1 Tax=Millisia brevis TaxID=264148 RepID=UPI00082CEE8E|nr:hypothetical protein [Millisia brevis]
MHAFVDETKQDGLLLATAIGTPATFAICRKSIRALILPGQDRIHFTAAIGAHRMVVEQDDSLLAADLRILHGARRAHAATAPNYAHARAAAEPLLRIPDAVAWCLATRKPGWRARIAPIVGETIRVDP